LLSSWSIISKPKIKLIAVWDGAQYVLL
jgi:hypothetical protein